jgi:oligopeptide transport system permease protein
MWIYALKRLLGAVPTLFVLATLTFFLVRLAPGGPFDTDKAFPPEIKANIERTYGLDQPVYVQYGRWLKGICHGDFHESFQYLGRPVTEIILTALPSSLFLGLLALIFSVGIGIPLGCFSAVKRGTFWDTSAMFIAISGISLPSYLIASVLILVFSLKLRLLPPALWEGASSIFLPVITLGTRPLAVIARLTRASLIESLNSDYIRTAYGKGLPETRIVLKHALKNSLIPVITVMGPLAASLVTGSFLVESVFQIPGIGRHFVQAVLNRDYPLVMGVTLTYGVILVLSNIAVDVAYSWLDPRIKQ